MIMAATNNIQKLFQLLDHYVPKKEDNWYDIVIAEEKDEWNIVNYSVKKRPQSTTYLNDKIKVCPKCSSEFTFTIEEQLWFKRKGFIERKSCKACCKKH